MRTRLTAALAAILLLSCAAHAGVAEELTAAIKKCAAITDDGARHACYDQLPTLLKTPVANTESAAAQPNAPSSDDESGSLPDLFASPPLPATHITATVESLAYEYGFFVVTLDNGQVWKQVAQIGGVVRFSQETKDQVVIWRSPFGYDVLKIKGHHTAYHVRRVK